jgi:hypothetical protein
VPGAKAATMIVPGYCSRCPNVAMIYLDRDVHRHSRLTCPLDRAYRTPHPHANLPLAREVPEC